MRSRFSNRLGTRLFSEGRKKLGMEFESLQYEGMGWQFETIRVLVESIVPSFITTKGIHKNGGSWLVSNIDTEVLLSFTLCLLSPG